MNHFKSAKLGLILSLVLFIGMAGTAFGAAPSGYWYLDDVQNGPYKDSLTSGDVNDATCYSGATTCPTFLASGNVGAAQTFDGTDDGIIVDALAGADSVFDLQDDGNFSVEVWFQNVNTGIALNQTEVLVGRSDSTTGNSMQWWIGIRRIDPDAGAKVQVAARIIDQEGDGAGSLNLIANTATTPVDVTTPGWHQAILIKEGNTVSLYVDNVPEDTKTIDYTADQTGNGLSSVVAPLGIGLLYTATDGAPTTGAFYQGDIDQVAIYNQALTAQEVSDSFTAGSANQLLEFAPVFSTIDFGTIALGYEFDTNLNVVGNPVVSDYTLGTAPTGLVLDPSNSGDVAWIPTDQQIGPATFNVTATNTVGSTVQDLKVEVVDVCATVDAYWDLDETTEPFDGQVHGEATHPDVNDAVCIGTGCPTVDSDTNAVNGALAFDGSTQGLEVAASGAKDKVFDWAANESFTISLFMKPNVTGFADGSTEVMVGRWITGTNLPQWWIGLRDDSGGVVAPRLFARLESVNGDGNATPITDAVSPTTISDGTWYHVALVYDHTTGNVSLYLDGVLEARETISFDPATDFTDDTNPLNIGYLFNGTSNMSFWGGSLDEIAFFGSALDASVLLQHASQNVGRGFCNDPPTITTTAGTNAAAGVEYTYAPAATVDEEGDTYEWSLPTKPDSMTIDATTGAISWTPTNADAAATVPVVLMVSDGFGGTDTESFEITVSGDVSPVISAQTPVSIAAGATYTIKLADLTITDPDSTAFTLAVLPGTNYTVSGDTVTPDSGFTGDLTVPITVNDGTSESAQFSFMITVGGDQTPDSSGGGGGGGGGGCFIDSAIN